ncbi:hypothetical protein GQ600_9912 [Phytophthora cactorum]|nr:hypothetical protein GQ600_9912 [Phytophthora cactorum]
MKRAAEHSDLEMVKHEAFNLDGVMDSAAACGDLTILQWFHEYRDGRCRTDAMDQAAGNGHLEVSNQRRRHERTFGSGKKWLHLSRSEGCTTVAIDGAAGNSHLKAVKWLCCHHSLRSSRDALIPRCFTFRNFQSAVRFKWDSCLKLPGSRLCSGYLIVLLARWMAVH